MIAIGIPPSVTLLFVAHDDGAMKFPDEIENCSEIGQSVHMPRESGQTCCDLSGT
jgi:hypothetical protein